MTTDFPVVRILLVAPSVDISALPETVIQLMKDLTAIGRGDEPVIPDLFYVCTYSRPHTCSDTDQAVKESMCQEHNELHQPQRHWFKPVSKDDETELHFRNRQLGRIWHSTVLCEEELEHEAGWNDSVHGPLLDEAFEDMPGIARRNM